MAGAGVDHLRPAVGDRRDGRRAARAPAKKAEGLGWLAKYVRAQSRRTGVADVRFGEPFSLRERLDESDPLAMEKVAFEICDRINRTTPVVATSLVTLALLGVRDRALTLPEVRSVLEPLLDYVGGPRPADRRGRGGAAHASAACAGPWAAWPRPRW